MNINKSTLYIVGIPIGNIFDFTQKAIYILKNVDIIATEKINKAHILLKFLNITKKKIIVLNKFNEITLSFIIINYIKNGINIALISDAGTPLINDPGFFLLKYAYKNNIKIAIIPGISALTTSLSISSFNIKSFTFYGFIPKKIKIKKFFFYNLYKNNTLNIFFESPKRLITTLNIISNKLNKNSKILIIKDVTKIFENVLLTDINYIILKNIPIQNFIKGELTILLKKTHITYIYKKTLKKYKICLINTYKKQLF